MSVSSLFAQPSEVNSAPAKEFGERYSGRYHLPLLPGEQGTKAGGDYAPRGVRSATNLAGAIVDSRALQIWERERSQMGMVGAPELFERASLAVNLALASGVDPSSLAETSGGRALRAELADIHEAAKTAVGANRAAVMGTNRHTAWEERGRSGALIGTPSMNEQIIALEALLEAEGLVRVPGLSERVVRNERLNAAGRFDDVLMSVKTGRLFLADLKTKRRAFFTWLEAWIQLTVYATAEWMLDDERTGYVPGPAHHVDQECAILLRMPSNGEAPYLEPVDLIAGMRWAELARDVAAARSEAASVKTVARAAWRD